MPATRPFDRVILNPRERPLSGDTNQGFSVGDYTVREVLARLFLTRVGPTSEVGATPTGFLADGFQVRPEVAPGLFVRVMPGLGFQVDVVDVPTNLNGADFVDDRSAYKPLPLLTTATIPVPASDPVNPRLDIVEVRYDRKVFDATTRDVLNTGTGAFDPLVLNKTLSWLLDGLATVNGIGPINYKTGVAAGVPVAPAVSAGYVQIARVLRPTLSITVLENHIADTRFVLSHGDGHDFTMRVRTDGAIITGITVQGPPGFRMGARFTAGLGFPVEMNILLPQLVDPAHFSATFQNVVPVASGAPAAGNFPVVATNVTPWVIKTVTAVEQATLAVCTPPINAAIGSKVLTAEIASLVFDGAANAFTANINVGGGTVAAIEYYVTAGVRL